METVKRRTFILYTIGFAITVIATGCVCQRTVTDSSGHQIYQQPEVHTPWESIEKQRNEVLEKERALGYY